MSPADEFTLALYQHSPTPEAIDTSLLRLDEQLRLASTQGAQLLLVPEASLTGYNISLASAQHVAVEHDSDTTEQLKRLCQQYKIALAFGYIERDADTLYNAVSVINASGEFISHYRKTHLWGELDRSLFKAGDSFSPVFELDGWRLGTLICYDIEFPESVRHLALNNAEIVLAPTALMTPWSFVAEQVTRVRAAENQVYFAYANYCGSENDIDYVGHSCIVGPEGEACSKALQKPALLVSTLTRQRLIEIRQNLPYHRDRRPELYQAFYESDV